MFTVHSILAARHLYIEDVLDMMQIICTRDSIQNAPKVARDNDHFNKKKLVITALFCMFFSSKRFRVPY
jgi:hypothetical protein